MRVVHLARGRDWRGGERQVLRLMESLNDTGQVAQLLVTGVGTPLAEAATRAGLPVHLVGWSEALDPRALLSLLSLPNAPACPTLLHAHDAHALILARIAARLRRWPLIATRRSDLRPGRWSAWRSADRVIAISAAVRDALLAGGVAADRITLIPSAVPFGPRSAAPPTAGHPPRPLLAVGALTSEKGHDILLAAFARLWRDQPALRLQLAGEGPRRRHLQRLAEQLGCGAAVDFLGQVEPIGPLLAGAAMLIQPSRREALGTAVLEAMVVGIPVIASRTGGLAELLEPDAGLLVAERLADDTLRVAVRGEGFSTNDS